MRGGGVTGKTGTAAESGYVWANNVTSASYTPSLTYSYNSRGGANTITRSAAGIYQVKIGNLSTTGGHVQVTSYGAGSVNCKVQSWGPQEPHRL